MISLTKLFTFFSLAIALSLFASFASADVNSTWTLSVTSTQQANVSINGTSHGETPVDVLLLEGVYEVEVSAENYVTNITLIDLTTNMTHDVVLEADAPVIVNHTLTITSTPSAADITINGTSYGVTPQAISLEEGTYDVALNLAGYHENATTLTLTTDTVLSFTLSQNSTNSTGNTTNSTGNSTNSTNSTTSSSLTYKGTVNITAPSGQTILETQTAHFTATFIQPMDVSWFVNGTLIRTSSGTSDTFDWNPGINYWDDNNAPLTVPVHMYATQQADVNSSENLTWNVGVKNVFNTFWSQETGTDSDVHVFTPNSVQVFDGLIVVIENAGTTQQLVLHKNFISSLETDWSYSYGDMPAGNTYIRQIIASDSVIGYEETFDVPGNLAHFRQPTSSSGNGGSSGGGGGGGAGGPAFENRHLPSDEEVQAANPAPEFIYAVFDDDVIARNETVGLKLDAKDDGGVVSVTAKVVAEDGSVRTLELKRTDGSATYGTWTTTLRGFPDGKNMLSSVTLKDDLNKTTTASVDGIAFYVLGEHVTQGESLILVYALIDKNTVNAGEQVTVKLDARDFKGIKKASALIRSKDAEITVPLSLSSGDSQYGTWSGSLQLDTPDTTYTFVSVTLDNGEKTREIRVYGQKVYVNYVEQNNALTGNVIAETKMRGFSDVVRNPATPLIVGLVGMGLAMLIISSMTFMRKR